MIQKYLELLISVSMFADRKILFAKDDPICLH